jgi:AraC-like DNA-binding protein
VRLPESRGNLTALALELGFASHSHFTDTFRRAFGVAPSAVA